MVKEGCFLLLKTRKALENQGLLCQGAILLPHYVCVGLNLVFRYSVWDKKYFLFIISSFTMTY